MLPILTVSSIKRYRRCPREYYYRVERGLVADRAHALRFGSLVHDGLEAWWTADESKLDDALAVVRAAADVDPYDSAKVEVLLHGYHARWQAEPLETLAAEVEFATELRNPVTGRPSKTWRLAGKIDAIARDEKGQVWLVEHKTSSEDISLGSDYWSRLALDSQVSTYFVGARALGYEPVGCVYDVVGKPGLRPKKATPEESRKYKKDGSLYANQRTEDESPEEYSDRLVEAVASDPDRYYARGEVVRLESEELDAAHDTWQMARMIRESQLADRWPRNPDACQRYGRTCAYWGLCTKTASEEDYEIDAPHTELEVK